MTRFSLLRALQVWPIAAFAALLLALLPATASAQLSATATITPSQIDSTTYHYEITLTNTGTTAIGTFWFAWVPGSGFMTVPPTNVMAPSNWTASLTNNGAAIEYEVMSDSMPPNPYAQDRRLPAGTAISGFSFNSTLTPAQLTSMTNGVPNDVSYVYIGAAFGDPGYEFDPDMINPFPPSTAVSSVLPGGRSVEVGATATVFANMFNTGTSALSGCGIELPASAPAGLGIAYQTTNPATNEVTGTPNTPVDIAANSTQTFVLSFTSSAALAAPGLELQFDCLNVQPVTSILGVNTVDLLFSATPIADIIAVSATASNNGIVTVPTNGTGAFAVASANVGATGSLTVSADTGSATLPVSIDICQTDPATAACLAAPAGTVTITDTAGSTPTFSVFVSASASIPLDAANSRIFLRFKDSSGTSHGSTSVAVMTD